jgi:hypothetical protein
LAWKTLYRDGVKTTQTCIAELSQKARLAGWATLTAKQQAGFSRAAAKLPDGLSYSLHDEADAPKYYTDVWGVDVCDTTGDSLGTVGKDRGRIWAQIYGEDEKLVRTALNRAAAALWHKQPVWA